MALGREHYSWPIRYTGYTYPSYPIGTDYTGQRYFITDSTVTTGGTVTTGEYVCPNGTSLSWLPGASHLSLISGLPKSQENANLDKLCKELKRTRKVLLEVKALIKQDLRLQGVEPETLKIEDADLDDWVTILQNKFR